MFAARLLAICIAATLISTVVRGAPFYSIVDLGVANEVIAGAAMNDHGQTALTAVLEFGAEKNSIYFDDGSGRQELLTLGGSRHAVGDINNAGVMVGVSSAADGRDHGAVFSRSGLED